MIDRSVPIVFIQLWPQHIVHFHMYFSTYLNIQVLDNSIHFLLFFWI